MDYSTSNSYANAMDTLLSDDEKVNLMHRINQTLPAYRQFAEHGVATTPKAFLNAIDGMSSQHSRIMLSSGFNPWIGNTQLANVKAHTPEQIAHIEKFLELRAVCSFDEFADLGTKLHEMSSRFRIILTELYGEDIGG